MAGGITPDKTWKMSGRYGAGVETIVATSKARVLAFQKSRTFFENQICSNDDKSRGYRSSNVLLRWSRLA
jgi:hypothetical protein